MKWPPTNCWTAPKTIEGNRHYQVKAYGGKNEKRWVDLFPTKNKILIKKMIIRILGIVLIFGTIAYYGLVLTGNSTL